MGKRDRNAAWREFHDSLPPLSDYAATEKQKAAYRKAMREWIDNDCPGLAPVDPDGDHERLARRDAALGITYTSNRPRSHNRRF